ncbi:MAG: trigger factor [Planctomycetota bacterium]|nr:trigger factor [Planctomycetota bacterium]
MSTTEAKNKIQISDAGPSLKKINIEIPAAAVGAKIKESIDTISVEAELPGFRKGHVPRSLVEKRFGATVRKEAKAQLVSAAYAEAVQEHKLKVVGEPTAPGLDAAELADGKSFAVTLEVEVMPEFNLPTLEGIAVNKPLLEVTDQMVTDELNKICINEGSLESREQGDAGDYCTGHGKMTGKDGTVFYDLQGAVVQIPTADKNGKGMILGVMVEDFTKQFGLPKPGDKKTIKVKGPENHEVEGIRNNDLTIEFTVDRVDRIIPAKTETLVAAFGMSDEAALKTAIRERMSQRVQVQQQTLIRQQIADYLLANTTLTLPERLTTNQAARTLENRRLELMYRGIAPQEIEVHMAELRSQSATSAQHDLKLFFILNKAAEDLKVQVTEGEMNQRIAMMAFERGVRPEKLRQELISRNQAGAIYQNIRDHKTMDTIASKAKVTEMSAEEFDKLAKAKK